MHHAIRAFRYPAFRIFWFGQLVAVLGMWIQSVAITWLVYKLSGSAFQLGLAAFAQQISFLVLSPMAGILADRFDRRKILIAIQASTLVEALALAALTLSGNAQVWQVVALAFWLGSMLALESPTRQAFLLGLIKDRADLPNAIAMQSMIMNTSRFVGPSIAGLILATAGETACFVIAACATLAIITAYAFIRVDRPSAGKPPSHWFADLTEGFRYAYGSRVSRQLLLTLTALAICTSPWQTLLPILAAESFKGDSRTFGFLIGAVGFGAVLSTAHLAARRSVRGLGAQIRVTTVVAALAMIALSFTTQFWQAMVLLVVFGTALVATVASANSILQTIVEDHMRGRLVAIFVMSFLGMAPIGNFIGGSVAEAIGAHHTFLVNGLALLVAAIVFNLTYPTWRAALAKVYAEKGVPRVASAAPRS